MKNNHKFSERDYQLLSAYLDGVLSPQDMLYVEKLLVENDHAKKAYQELKKVKTLLRFLPARKVPRDFTLSVHETRKFQIPSLAGVFRYSTAVSAILLVIVLTLDMFSPLQTRSLMRSGADFADNGIFESDMSMESREEAPQMMEAAPLLEKEEIDPEQKTAPDDEELQLENIIEEELDDAQSETAPLPEGEMAPEPKASPDDEALQLEGTAEAEQGIAQAEAAPSPVEEEMVPEQNPALDDQAPQMDTTLAEEHDKVPTADEDLGAIPRVSSAAPLRIIEIILACLTIISAMSAYFLRKRNL